MAPIVLDRLVQNESGLARPVKCVMYRSVQKTPTTGRPLEFDLGKAQEAIMRLFWEKGFLGVSLPDLEKRTGLSRSSLYNSFGSKQEVFEQSLERYRQAMGEQMCRPLETGEQGLADLLAFFDAVGGMFTNQRGATGCLMVNSMVEFGGADAAVARHQTEHLTRVRRAITAALERAVARGEIPADTVESRSNVALSLLLGITVAARAGLPRREIGTMVESARTLIREWADTAAGWRDP